MAKKMMFTPAVLKTKEELLVALKKGDIKSSKYNALDEDQKLFVEMIVFGGYKAGQAMKVIRPGLADPGSAGRRMVAKPNVAEVLEELTYKRDDLWLATVTSARDSALGTLEYIMKTTKDENLMAATAKAIIDAADKAVKSKKKPEEQVNMVRFDIQYGSNMSPNVGSHNPEEVVVVQGEDNAESGMPYKLSYAENIRANYDPDAVEVVEADVVEDKQKD